MPGCASTKPGTTFVSTCSAAIADTVMRMRPVTAPGVAVTDLSDSSAWSIAGPAWSNNRRPASVSATLRDVRCSSGTPTRSSSCRTDWLNAEVDTPSSRAAPA